MKNIFNKYFPKALKISYKKLFVFILCIYCFKINAQYRITDNNTIAWIPLTTNIKLNNKWSAFLETQTRLNNFGTSAQQMLFRPGITFNSSNKVAYTAGYGFIITYPYGDYPIANNGKFIEHRSFQQIQLKNEINAKIETTSRLRLEQRWLAVNNKYQNPESFLYLNRCRLMYKVSIKPLKKIDKLYTTLSDEIFIGFGKNVKYNIFDQNRIIAAIGYPLSQHFTIEGGAISQILQQGGLIQNKAVFQYNLGPWLNINIKL